MTYDAIIIGAGLGGLAAGAKLAKEGKKVLLFGNLTFLKVPEFYRWIGAGLDIVIPWSGSSPGRK